MNYIIKKIKLILIVVVFISINKTATTKENNLEYNKNDVKNYLSLCSIYIGNDSFGHHISCQLGIPCFIIMLDTPRAYSDYSVNQNRIIPPNTNLNDITHDSKLDPNSISVDMVLNEIKSFI